MAHDHHHHHHHHHFDPEEKPSGIITAFWLNTTFAVIEIIGGLYTNSVAIVSDAIHDLGDSLSLGLAYYFHRKSKQQGDREFNYGYRRFSLLGAFINSVILVVSSVFIMREAAMRLFTPEMPNTKGMLILAILGILVNGAALLRLRKGKSVNEKVISLHFVEDVLGWTAVLIGSIVMMFADVPVLDPILSILICLYILYNVYKNLRTTFRILLQGSPEGIRQDQVRKKVLSVPGVLDMHDMHFWTMDGQYNVMTLHVVVPADKSLEEVEKIKNEVKHCLIHLDVQHTTVEIESQNNDCYAELKKTN